MPTIFVFTSTSLLRITFAVLEKPWQGYFGKFQESSESRFGSFEKDHYLLKIIDAIYLKSGGRFFNSVTMLVLESKGSYQLYNQIKSFFILSYISGACCRCHNLPYFNNKVCLTKKYPL